jgi:hypothetical protein
LPTTPFCASTTGSGRRHWPTTLSPVTLHEVLDRYATQCCPVFDLFAPSYHWSYEQLSRQAILTVKAEHVATFQFYLALGHKITPQLAQEIGSQFATRIEGTCVKHRFGKSSIKIYDKFGLVPAHRDHHQRRLRFERFEDGLRAEHQIGGVFDLHELVQHQCDMPAENGR